MIGKIYDLIQDKIDECKYGISLEKKNGDKDWISAYNEGWINALEYVQKYIEKNASVEEISEKPKEAVDHPQHYNRKGAMECIDEMRLIFGDYETAIFCKLNAYKYRYRAGSKGNAEEDLRKSDWYIKKYKELRDKPCGYMVSTTDNSNITLLNNRTKD